MPEIIEIPFDYDTISLSEEDEFRDRSSGLHLSPIIRDMMVTAGLNKWKNDPDPIKRKMQFQKGFLWERIIQQCLQIQMKRDIEDSGGRLIRPGEHTNDGIISTPDAIDTVSWHLEEWKCTAISPKNLEILSDKPDWVWAAGWHLSYFDMKSVVFRIWHHREFDPTIKQYKVTFTDYELLTNKERIINHARAKGML